MYNVCLFPKHLRQLLSRAAGEGHILRSLFPAPKLLDYLPKCNNCNEQCFLFSYFRQFGMMTSVSKVFLALKLDLSALSLNSDDTFVSMQATIQSGKLTLCLLLITSLDMRVWLEQFTWEVQTTRWSELQFVFVMQFFSTECFLVLLYQLDKTASSV